MTKYFSCHLTATLKFKNTTHKYIASTRQKSEQVNPVVVVVFGEGEGISLYKFYFLSVVFFSQLRKIHPK